MRPARGACRHEACQRAFKEPRPRKRKQMAAGITPLMDCTCSPRAPLPQLLFNQCPENPLGALKWKNVSMLGLSTQHQITRSLLTPVQHCPFHQHTFTNRRAQFMFMARSAPLLLSTQCLTDNKQKRDAERNESKKKKTITTTNWRYHLQISRGF